MKCLRSRFGGLHLCGVLFLALFLALRVVLCVRIFGEVDGGLAAMVTTFAVGLLYDLTTFSCLALPVALFLLLFPDRLFRSRIHRHLAVVVYFLAVFVAVFDAAAEWIFWGEFGSRFNFVAVDYLIYTNEVLHNVWESYPIVLIVAALLAVALALVLLTRRLFVEAFAEPSTFRQRLRPATVYLLASAILTLAVAQLPPRISPNRYNNELSRNGTYSFMAALLNNVIDYPQFYLTVDDTAAFRRARELLATDNSRYTSDDPFDLSRQIMGNGPEERRNLVFIVVESLSAEYLGAYGSTEGLTPNLDALAGESLMFTNLYASGTRTDRGLEAIVLSIPPTPGRSLVKRPDNHGLFSLGSLLQDLGYDTKFIYGGFSFFDNMGSFFSGNGFATVDQNDFARDEITFSNAWGVCDEDLMNRALKECDRSQAQGKPFCSLLLTTSNHRPFTYPGKVDPALQGHRAGGVKYTDYAIGRFLEQARTRPWFSNTIFIIVADHCASSAGRTEIPVEKYHIPLLIYAPGFVQPGRVTKLGCQMDLTPTVLGLLHLSYRTRFYGRDMLRPGPGRALLGNYQKVGLLTDEKLQLLLFDKRSQTYQVGPDLGLTEAAEDPALLLDAVSYYQTVSFLLEHGRYPPIR